MHVKITAEWEWFFFWFKKCSRGTKMLKVRNNLVKCKWRLYMGAIFKYFVVISVLHGVEIHRRTQSRQEKQHTGDSMSSSNWTEHRSHFSNVWARCMIFLTIFSRSVCSSNRSLTTSKRAWTQAEKTLRLTWPPTTNHSLSVSKYFLKDLLNKHNKHNYYLYPHTISH